MIQGIERSYPLDSSLCGRYPSADLLYIFIVHHPCTQPRREHKVPNSPPPFGEVIKHLFVVVFCFVLFFLIFFFVSVLPLDGTSQLLAIFVNLRLFTAYGYHSRKLNAGPCFVGRDFGWTAGCGYGAIPEMH